MKISTVKTKAVSVLQFVAFLLFSNIAQQAYAQPFEQVTIGAAHICALNASGEVECTSTNIARRYLPPENLSLMREISAGQQHTCGITLDGGVECWGTDAFGVLRVPAFDAPVASISSGFNHTCAVDINNQTVCWGLGSNNQLAVPDSVDGFVKVDAGRTASCGIDTRGDIHCWSTDFFFNTDTPVAGPFVDLDIDSNQACGLTSNGDIECWAARERLNLFPPTNGPYTDLTVTNSAICGLRVDQFLDCSFAAPTAYEVETLAEEYPLDVRFSSIERSNLQFGGVPICGVRAENGTISCFGGDGTGGNLPSPPGVNSGTTTLTASNIVLGLTAEVYGRNQVELFWNRVPGVIPPISVEVYRDDELLSTTRNSFSFYDNDRSITSEESRYRVRTVDDAGNVGEFSNSILVDRTTLEVSLEGNTDGVDNPRPDSPLRVQNLSVTAFTQFVLNNDSFIMSWNLNNPSNLSVAGFEVRVDNEPVGFTDGTTFIGEGVLRNFCQIYSVAAIANDGSILDYASAAYGRNAYNCPRVPQASRK